jgi:uncharacterized protein YyaL (SSP411 family)
MNALAGETSPYLLQHADNPVDWYPWGPEALAKAARENKPILLSIGYSACHWCHVMAHESFEDPATAAMMNDGFVNIKVDREERPDIDKIYQAAQYLLTQNQGGWPLTMFLTPDDQVPFLGGTYFPPEPRHGLPSFRDLLQRVRAAYAERETDIRAQNTEVLSALAQLQTYAMAQTGNLNDAPFTDAREQAARAFDHRLGGFGRAPKFPHPTGLERLMRDYARGNGTDEHALHMAVFTLQRMANGGLYDHLGGGFYRYSTDNQWMIPHFEKMLYDNGPLLGLYAHAWQITRNPRFAAVADETIAWVAREMTAPGGGFYSSLDADSEGEEGRFYAWQADEIERIIGPEAYAPFARRFGLNRKANFEGRWHLYVVAQYHEIANVLGGDPGKLEALAETARQQLFDAREQRVRPARDDKILTSWNALMIKGLAIAGKVFIRDDAIDAAHNAIDFVREQLWRDGRLLATCKDGKAHLSAYLDDYAFLLDALLHALAARWRSKDLDFAIAIAECLLTHFEDPEAGGFFFTAHDHETLIQRSKPLADDALPAGNGVAATALARLGHLLGEARYTEACERTLRASWEALTHAPGAHNALLDALEEYLEPPGLIVLRGDDSELTRWHDAANANYAPQRLCLSIPADAVDLPGLLGAREPRGVITAYVCKGSQCLAPIANFAEFERAIN